MALPILDQILSARTKGKNEQKKKNAQSKLNMLKKTLVGGGGGGVAVANFILLNFIAENNLLPACDIVKIL